MLHSNEKIQRKINKKIQNNYKKNNFSINPEEISKIIERINKNIK